jgi:hypothetical protein
MRENVALVGTDMSVVVGTDMSVVVPHYIYGTGYVFWLVGVLYNRRFIIISYAHLFIIPICSRNYFPLRAQIQQLFRYSKPKRYSVLSKTKLSVLAA